MDGGRTNKRICSVCLVCVSTTNYQRYPKRLSVSHCPIVQQNDVLALRWAPKVEPVDTIGRNASLSIQPTAIVSQPVCRCACDERVLWCEIEL